MSVVLSKLTMCVCAASTGAAIMPAVKAVRHHMASKPAAHRAAAPSTVAAASRVDCLPPATQAIGGLGELSGAPLASGPSPLAITANGPSNLGVPGEVSGGGNFGSGGGYNAGGGGGGGGGGGFLAGELPGGGLPGDGQPGGLLPIASSAPEPAAWAMMVGGFGLLGAKIRYGRAQVTSGVAGSRT